MYGKSNRVTVIVVKRVFSLAKTIVVDVFVIYIPQIPLWYFLLWACCLADYIVPGFNDYVKDLHSTARSDYVAWRDAGMPRSGAPCSNMRRSRLEFKYALRHCKRNEDAIRANQYAKSLLHKDMVSPWKHIRKSNNVRVPLASTVGGVRVSFCFSRGLTEHKDNF